ncbi:hypothetical protein [Brevibacillus brevis]|uniref:hypothetical protein n=1 Tax=Brevibacillus brevis TaxID=1393 RepID=UPI00211AEBC0|nr:hypothetical protein [Brevibacillus brevis]
MNFIKGYGRDKVCERRFSGFGDYVQYFNNLVASINDIPNKLMSVVSVIHTPIQHLTNTLIVTNILLGLLVLTSIANVYMLWRNGKKRH